MTIDEAVFTMEYYKLHFALTPKSVEAFDMAIKALEQQPTDAVSRQAVLDGLASIAKAKAKSDTQKSLMGRVMFFVEQFPSVTPQQKVGYWEWLQYDGNPNIGNWHCSECHCIGRSYFDYCPACGIKMSEIPTGEEGSDKE